MPPNYVHCSKREKKKSISYSAFGKSIKIISCQLPLAMGQPGLPGGIPLGSSWTCVWAPASTRFTHNSLHCHSGRFTKAMYLYPKKKVLNQGPPLGCTSGSSAKTISMAHEAFQIWLPRLILDRFDEKPSHPKGKGWPWQLSDLFPGGSEQCFNHLQNQGCPPPWTGHGMTWVCDTWRRTPPILKAKVKTKNQTGSRGCQDGSM